MILCVCCQVFSVWLCFPGDGGTTRLLRTLDRQWLREGTQQSQTSMYHLQQPPAGSQRGFYTGCHGGLGSGRRPWKCRGRWTNLKPVKLCPDWNGKSKCKTCSCSFLIKRYVSIGMNNIFINWPRDAIYFVASKRQNWWNYWRCQQEITSGAMKWYSHKNRTLFWLSKGFSDIEEWSPEGASLEGFIKTQYL